MSVIINGSIRSGTTWVMEVLSKHNAYFSVFEPDNFLKEAKRLKIRYRYIKPSNDNPELQNLFTKLINGKYYKILNNQVQIKDKILSPSYFKNYIKSVNKEPIIKFTRGHLFLPYLSQKYSPKIICILRNPFYACYSAYKKGYLVSHFEEIFDERQDDLYNEYPDYYYKIQKSLKLINLRHLYSKSCSKFERQAYFFFINWAFVNSFLLDQYNQGNIKAKLVSFEHLQMQPIDSFTGICNYIGIEFTKSMHKHINIPSSSTQQVSKNVNFKKLINEKYGEKLFEELSKIIHIFELEDIIDRSDIEPFKVFSDVY